MQNFHQNAKTQIRECPNTQIGHSRIFLEFGHSLAVKMDLVEIDKDELPGVSMWTF